AKRARTAKTAQHTPIVSPTSSPDFLPAGEFTEFALASMEREHVPLCDLGFGPLECFVTLKPLSTCHVFAHLSEHEQPVGSEALEHSVARRGNMQEMPIQDDQKATTEPAASQKAKPKQHQYQLSDNDSPSLQSFSSGGSSPSSVRPRHPRPRTPRQGVPVRHFTGEMAIRGQLKDTSKASILRDNSSWKHESGHPPHHPHPHVTGNDETDRQLLLDAWKSCRLIEASRLVQKSRTSKRHFHEILDEASLEVIHRVEASYTQSLDELVQHHGSGWRKERDEKRDLDMAFRLTADNLQAVATTVFSGFSLIEIFDALRDYVQQDEYSDDAYVGQLDNELMQDCLLHVRRHGHGNVEDNILHLSCMDALDEPLGALWLSSYTPPLKRGRHARSFRGIALPKPQTGAVRLAFWRSSFAIAPVWSGLAAAAPSAVRVTYAVARRPSSAASIFPSRMYSEVSNRLAKFKDFLQLRGQSASTVADCDVYSHIKRHLMECAPCGPHASRNDEVSFEELASFLPDDWADYHDAEHVNDFR
ncbi:unnamed protein product, partial [Symbiodinium necroappetens]